MKVDYFEDLSVPGVPTTSPPDRGHRKPCNDGNVPSVPTVPTSFNADVAELAGLPLAAKLRAYGDPFPLMVNSRVAAWLVPDDASKIEKAEPVYTAAEVERMAQTDQEEA